MRKVLSKNLAVLTLAIIFSSCMYHRGEKGSGNVISQSRFVGDFNKLEVKGAFDVLLKQGDSTSVTIWADDNLLPDIITKVDDGTLEIYNNKSLTNFKMLKAEITFKKLDEITGMGAVNITGTDSTFRFDVLEIKLMGASDLKMNLRVDNLNITSEGASKVSLSGNCNSQKVKMNGAGTYKAFDLISNDADVELNGADEAYLNVSHKLIADCIGASAIKYKGEPSDVESKTAGAGSIEKAK